MFSPEFTVTLYFLRQNCTFKVTKWLHVRAIGVGLHHNKQQQIRHFGLEVMF